MEGEGSDEPVEPVEPLFARSIREFAGQELVLVDHGRRHELLCGDELVAILGDPTLRREWEAQAREGHWRIALQGRRGWHLDLFDATTEDAAAHYEGNRWSAGGTIQTLPDGRSYVLRRRHPLSHAWTMRELSGEALLRMRSLAGKNDRLRVSVEDAARLDPRLVLVALLATSVILIEESAVFGDGGAAIGP